MGSTLEARVFAALTTAITELNEGLPLEKRLETGRQAAVFGEKGSLDSLGLATLVILSEQEIEREFGRAVSLADERAMSQKRSPFRTLGSMTDYVVQLLKENGHL